MPRGTQSDTQEFLADFNPHTSGRERRKLTRTNVYKASYTNALHDRDGKMIGDGTDFCDCLLVNCPGCHFPCVKCGSQKCSVDCRKNRKWTPDHIELEGTERIITLDKTLRDYHQKIAAQLAARAQHSNKSQ